MTVYAKIENNKLVTAYNGYNGVTGLADSPELCLANGFTAYTEEEISGYFGGTHQIIDGVLTDISETPEYIAEQFQKDIQYQHNAFNEFAREIIFQIQYNQALGNTTLVTSLQAQLQAEQQAVIARINAITEEYNENNQQST